MYARTKLKLNEDPKSNLSHFLFFNRNAVIIPRRGPAYSTRVNDIVLGLAFVVNDQERQDHDSRSDPVQWACVLGLQNHLPD
jgi:hypothetical protein